MSRHPLDAVRREPSARAALSVAAVATVLLGLGGLAAHHWNEGRREANVARAVAAKGWGSAQVEAIDGPECWRAREGYRWRTQTKSGWACAGPGDEVTLHEGPYAGRWP
jgi:hypothetical protein